MLARLVIALSGFVFLGAGLLFLAVPGVVTRGGIELTTATAVADLRAVYGGLEIGVGAFILVSAFRGGRDDWACLCGCFAFTGLALGRISGILLDGAWGSLTIALLVPEIFGAVANGAAYRAVVRGSGPVRTGNNGN